MFNFHRVYIPVVIAKLFSKLVETSGKLGVELSPNIIYNESRVAKNRLHERMSDVLCY